MRALPLPAALVLAALLVAAPALANPLLDSGKEAYQRGDFRAAIQKFTDAERSPELTEAELVEVYWYRGVCSFGINRPDAATKDFDKLLSLRPLYAPARHETPPNLRVFFQQRADAYRERAGTTLAPPSVVGAQVRTSLLAHPEAVASVIVFVRAPGDTPYQKLAAPLSAGSASARLEDSALWNKAAAAGKLEVVVEARNAGGNPVARLGDAVTPLTLPVSPEVLRAALAELSPPAPKPVDKPAPLPAVAVTPARPVEKPAPTPPVEPAPVAKPADKPIDKPVDKPAVVVILRPTPGDVVEQPPAPVAPVPPAAAPPAAAVPAPQPAAPEAEQGGGRGRLVVRSLANVVLVGGVAGLLVAALSTAGAVAAWAGHAYTHYYLAAVGSDFLKQRDNWVLAWQATMVVGIVLIPVAVVAFCFSVLAGGGGMAMFVQSFLM